MAADPSTHGELDATLLEAFADMERRLQAGQSWDAHAFLADHPDFLSDPERVVDLLLHEYLLRRRLGEALDPQAWFQRFPRWEELLHRRLQTQQTVGGESAGLDRDAPTQDHTPAPASTPEGAIPELGRHELHEEIGRGGMGVVYRAHDLILNRPVALKMIVPRQGLLETPEAVQRFYREARAAARLRHPNIIPIHGMGLHQGRHCFTMPLLTGGSLAGRTGDRHRDARAAAALVEKMARAVQYAHEQGVIHRDLKPANILLDEQGEPLVADFGLAKVLDGDADASIAGQRVGTPSYMSPEQAAGHTWEVSARSDVWALGVILYELLTGKRPFPDPTPEGVYKQVLTGRPAPPRMHRGDLPSELEEIVLKCLQKDPGQRYAAAGDMAEDLARWLRGERTVRRPSARPRRPSKLWGRRLVWVGAFVLLLVLAAVLYLAREPAKPSNGTPPQDSEVTDRAEEGDALLREFALGRPVGLIGPLGPPRWYRWQTDANGFAPPASSTKPLHLEAFQVVLMQLAPPDRRRRAFRLEAEVWHELNNNGWAGLYCDAQEREHGGREVVFSSLVFADQGLNAGQVRVRRQLYRGAGAEGRTPQLNLTSSVLRDVLPPLNHQNSPWRKLVLEVRRDAIRVSWDGEAAQEVSIRDLMEQTNRFLSEDAAVPNPPPPPPFDPGAGLGLYLEDGHARFRNVVVQLPPEP